MKKKSGKQLIQQRNLERKKRRKVIEANYDDLQKDWESLDKSWKEVFGDFISKEKYIDRELEKWENAQPLIITGKYLDVEKVVSNYQQKFVEYIQQICPDVIEELRPLVPYFDAVFEVDKENYNSLFDWSNMSILVGQNRSLDTYINSLLKNSKISLYPYLQFRPFKIGGFLYDYKWGEFLVLFSFLDSLFPSADLKTNESEILEKKTELSLLLKNKLVWNREYSDFPKQIKEEKLQKIIEYESERIVIEFTDNLENCHFATESQLNKFLNNILANGKSNIPAFIKLKLGLLKWAETHNLKKDWILRYAYEILRQFSQNPDLKVVDINIPSLQVRALVAFPFEFKFDGWLAGDEEKEKFEARLKKNFNAELEHYFQIVGRQLNLKNQTKVTNPRNYKRVKWLVRWVVQNWTKEQILNELDQESQNQLNEKYYSIRTIEAAFQQFEKYDLPVKE